MVRPEAMPDAKDAIDAGPTPASHSGARWSVTDTLLLAVLSLVGLGLRLVAIGEWSFDVTEAETFRALTQPLSGGSEAFMGSDSSTYPLVYLLLRGLLETGVLSGFTEGWIRLPFAFAGCLLVPCLALFVRPLLGRGAACMAALVIAVHPGHIAASQTADPVVFAMTAAVCAGALRVAGRRWSAYLMCVVAGGCHPIGWLCGLGLLCASTGDRVLRRTPAFLWWLLLAHAVVLVPCVLGLLGLSLTLLAIIAVLVRTPVGGDPDTVASGSPLGLGIAALLPLVAGGIWWLVVGEGAESATIAALAPLTVLASWSVVQFFRRLRDRLVEQGEDRVWLTRALVVTPSLLLLGELATSTFLYFVIFGGARAPWRDVRDAVLAATTSGHQVEVVAGRGSDVMRAYLRPRHWRAANATLHAADPHPGVRVSDLPRAVEDAVELLARPDTMLVLQHDEWSSLQSTEHGRRLLEDFRPVEVWSSPQVLGDHSLYLLRRGRG